VLSFCAVCLGVLLWPAIRLGKWLVSSLAVGVSVSFLVIITGMYLTFTSYAEPMIMGIQGRYFIPLLLPLLVVIIELLVRTKTKITNTFTVQHADMLLVAMVCTSLFFAAAKFIFVTWG
jgi:uncharacterized membrane protein